MNYPMILIVGPSGHGKSSSLKNLPPDKTTVINCERKFLPFKNATAFKQSMPENAEKCGAEITKALSNKEVKYIAHDSMTKYFEMLLSQSKIMNKGYDIYNWLNDKITKYLEDCKNNNDKLLFMFSLDERVEYIKDNGSVVHSRRAYVPGKQWEGKIEKEFTIVLFTDIKTSKDNDTVEYRFITNSDGSISAKSPPGMFDKYIPNDLNFVAKRVFEYYGINQNQTPPPPEPIKEGILQDASIKSMLAQTEPVNPI